MSGRITTVSKPPKLERKKRVAAYAQCFQRQGRYASLAVRTGQPLQRTNPEKWRLALCSVYADEAKTGTKDSRADFKGLLPIAVPEKSIW